MNARPPGRNENICDSRRKIIEHSLAVILSVSPLVEGSVRVHLRGELAFEREVERIDEETSTSTRLISGVVGGPSQGGENQAPRALIIERERKTESRAQRGSTYS